MDAVLDKILSNTIRLHDTVPLHAREEMQYWMRFRPKRLDIWAAKTRIKLMRRTPTTNGKRGVIRCCEVEAWQLIKLMPATYREAQALIPTLNCRWTKELVDDIAPLRDVFLAYEYEATHMFLQRIIAVGGVQEALDNNLI